MNLCLEIYPVKTKHNEKLTWKSTQKKYLFLKVHRGEETEGTEETGASGGERPEHETEKTGCHVDRDLQRTWAIFQLFPATFWACFSSWNIRNPNSILSML